MGVASTREKSKCRQQNSRQDAAPTVIFNNLLPYPKAASLIFLQPLSEFKRFKDDNQLEQERQVTIQNIEALKQL